MNDQRLGRRIIEINEHFIGPTSPKLNTVRPRKLGDYPQLPAAYRDLIRRLSSPSLMGPPVCDELVALVRHLFTEEEAVVARHLGQFTSRRAAQVARAAGLTLEQVEPILDRLSNEKRIIVGVGQASDRRYQLLPIVPGMFEMALVSHTPESLGDWHRRFIELFEALYETGYLRDYDGYSKPAVRYIPLSRAIEAHPMAMPSDKLEVVLDHFDVFAVGQCQCRMAMQAIGQGCGKPLANCMVMGQWATRGIEAGALKQVPKKQAVEIKREAESHGLVNWMMNVESTRSQCSCSCCGCCCHAMRMINEFNAPGLIAQPHFLPRLDVSKCTYCGKCAKSCPMGAIAISRATGDEHMPGPNFRRYTHLRQRCIGCGLCALACDKQRALVMEPAPNYRPPYRSWSSLIARSAPGALAAAWKLWRRRP
jgi:formate hydrogenlyase subunit 6/NADH:ubiquinone oxidoreductase subunit I